MTEDEDILSLIPQKPPFVMVDELLFSDDNITRTSFIVTADNVFVIDQPHHPFGCLFIRQFSHLLIEIP